MPYHVRGRRRLASEAIRADQIGRERPIRARVERGETYKRWRRRYRARQVFIGTDGLLACRLSEHAVEALSRSKRSECEGEKQDVYRTHRGC